MLLFFCKRLSGFANGVGIVDDPKPQRHHADQHAASQFGKLIIDPRRHLLIIVPDNQTVALQLARCPREHTLGNITQTARNFGMAQFSFNAQCMDNP